MWSDIGRIAGVDEFGKIAEVIIRIILLKRKNI